MDRPDLAADERFGNAGGRRTHADALDAIVTEWTRTRDAASMEAALQAGAVPAHVVQTSRDLRRDPQLAHRGHFVPVEHPMGGTSYVEGSRFVLSRTPATSPAGAPSYGRDNESVLRDLLGYDDDAITALVADGALE
jgi:crotonobetainyl-CoA:carnitine CoA-transferase CaiB-like acyl-CoA transferase